MPRGERDELEAAGAEPKLLADPHQARGRSDHDVVPVPGRLVPASTHEYIPGDLDPLDR